MSDTNNLRARIAEELDRQPSDIIGSPSLSMGLVICREINNAIRHYESTRFRWNEVRNEEFATTTASTRTVSLPPKIVKMDSLKLVDNDAYVTLDNLTWDQIEEMDRDVTGSDGTPTKFTVYGNVLRFFPVPDDTYTLVGSYIRRYLPTSLTASYCSVITMGGASLTVTSTASHHNRLDGWTTDGEELIRARAIAAVEINYLKVEGSITEMRGLALAREPYLSVREKIAYESLRDEALDLQSSGHIAPYEI